MVYLKIKKKLSQEGAQPIHPQWEWDTPPTHLHSFCASHPLFSVNSGHYWLSHQQAVSNMHLLVYCVGLHILLLICVISVVLF